MRTPGEIAFEKYLNFQHLSFEFEKEHPGKSKGNSSRRSFIPAMLVIRAFHCVAARRLTQSFPLFLVEGKFRYDHLVIPLLKSANFDSEIMSDKLKCIVFHRHNDAR